jgi:hypothetical protein
MIDGEPTGCLFLLEWPRGSLRQWLVALGTFSALLLVFYVIFSLLGL